MAKQKPKKKTAPDPPRSGLASAWLDAVAAAEKHVAIAKQVQARALASLNTIQINDDNQVAGDAADVAKLLTAVTTSLNRATSDERAAHDKLIDLHRRTPKKLRH